MADKSAHIRHIPPFPRLSGRLYIFPAFIPMVELLPWLLTAVGALASATQVAFWRQHRRKLLAVTALCFIAASAVYGWGLLHKPTEAEGSRMIAAKDLPVLTVATPVPVATPSLDKTYDDFAALWTVPTPHELLSGPVFAGNLVLFGTYDGAIEARSRGNGALAWSLQKHEPVFTNAAVHGGMAFVGEGLHTAPAAALTAFSLPDGKPLWERQFRSHVESEATLDPAHDRLWTCAGSEGLWSLDMRDGAVLWRQKIGHIDATPLYHEGHIYASAQPDETKPGSILYALAPDSGAIEWQLPLPGNTMGSPQVGPEGQILLTTAIGQVGPKVETDRGWSHAAGRAGKLLWSVKLPGMPLPEAVVLKDAGLVIHTLKSGEIIALHTADGKTAWRVKMGAEFDAPAALNAHTSPPCSAPSRRRALSRCWTRRMARKFAASMCAKAAMFLSPLTMICSISQHRAALRPMVACTC